MKDPINDWLTGQSLYQKLVDAIDPPHLRALQEMQFSTTEALRSYLDLPRQLEQIHKQINDIHQSTHLAYASSLGSFDSFRHLTTTSLGQLHQSSLTSSLYLTSAVNSPANFIQQTAKALSQIIQSDIQQDKYWLSEFLESSQRIDLYAALSNPATDLWKQIANARGFTEDLLESIDKSLANLETEDEDPFSPFERVIQLKIESLRRGEISYTTLLNFINTFVTIVSIIVTLQSMGPSNNTDKQIDQRFQQIERTQTLLLDTVETIKPDTDPSRYYIDVRQTALRIKPKNKSAQIAILYPNQRVRLLKEKGRWIYVEYFDYTEGIPKAGWARKKYMELIAAQETPSLDHPASQWSGKRLRPIFPTTKLQGDRTVSELLLEDRE
jgi:hypothetical protein